MEIFMFEDNLMERYELTFDRIRQISEACDIKNENFNEYFKRTAQFIVQMNNLKRKVDYGILKNASLEELQLLNKKLYEDVLSSTGAYDSSFANPVYACEKLGEDYGRLMSFLYVEIRGMIVYAYEKRTAYMTALAELFVEIYCMFEGNSDIPRYKSVLDSVYWYVSDYSDDAIEYRISEMLNPVSQAQVFLLNRTDLKIKVIKQILKPQASQILGKLVHHQQLRMQHCLQT